MLRKGDSNPCHSAYETELEPSPVHPAMYFLVGPCGLEPLPEGPDLQSGCYIQIALSSHNPTYLGTQRLLNQEYPEVTEAFEKS